MLRDVRPRQWLRLPRRRGRCGCHRFGGGCGGCARGRSRRHGGATGGAPPALRPSPRRCRWWPLLHRWYKRRPRQPRCRFEAHAEALPCWQVQTLPPWSPVVCSNCFSCGRCCICNIRSAQASKAWERPAPRCRCGARRRTLDVRPRSLCSQTRPRLRRNLLRGILWDVLPNLTFLTAAPRLLRGRRILLVGSGVGLCVRLLGFLNVPSHLDVILLRTSLLDGNIGCGLRRHRRRSCDECGRGGRGGVSAAGSPHIPHRGADVPLQSCHSRS